MQQKQGSSKKKIYLDPIQILSLYKLNHIQLDIALRQLKDRIDNQFKQFRANLISSLNHLNFIRYKQYYPSDDFKFVFKEKVNISANEGRLEQKEQIMQRMKDFQLIKQDIGGINDNCIFELEKATHQSKPILNFKELCPSGVTFLERNKDTIREFIEFWKATEGDVMNLGSIFKELSPVFPRGEIKKLGVIFSQQNKRISHAKLLYRASQNNFQSALFKQLCAGRPNTLLIAKSQKGQIFGGFTPAKWLNTKEKQFVADPTATSFLYSLDHNLVFPIKRTQLDYAISAYGGWGPIYGSPYGPDLSISDKCHMNDNSCSSLGSHYDIPVNVKEYSNEAFSLLAGAKKFKVIEYEVYELVLQ